MITVEEVTRTYGDFTAVDDISFTAEPGRVTGFLGPNGAGKSTTMRIIVGLTSPTQGSAQVLGRRFADLPNPGREVGVLLDASAQHAGRTGREVLTLARKTMGLPATRVTEMLELVSLTDAEADRRVGDYSLGMRQRLGIAHALLGDPEVLILDEPANGLDPAGIRWMRDLLRGYADRGSTVLLSSHLLHEIEVVADDLVVIGQGRIVAQGTKTDLLSAVGTQARTRRPNQLKGALTAAGLTYTDTIPTAPNVAAPAGSDPAHLLRIDADTELVGHLAHRAGVPLIELRAADGAGLEEMFLELTADTQREAHPTNRPQGAVA
jgi:ABC-2 type transport system ATP-binding protein